MYKKGEYVIYGSSERYMHIYQKKLKKIRKNNKSVLPYGVSPTYDKGAHFF